ncbi:Precursor of CEP14, partial [Cucurbita argyrosperma subsp. argyrosperma]
MAARFTLITCPLLLLLLFASSALTSHAARLLPTTPSPHSLFLAALPKGTVPSSAPSKKAHALLLDQKLTARHLVESVPSPGIGH